MNYYTAAIKKYATFNGRASRVEYWYFFLFNLIIGFALGLAEGFLGIYSSSDESVLANVYSLIVFLPSIAVGVRRMHDVNKSGWFIIVPLYNLLLAVRKGDKETNRFGAPRIGEGIEDSKPIEPQKYCSNCGKSIDADSKFCIKCGSKIKDKKDEKTRLGKAKKEETLEDIMRRLEKGIDEK